jgi:hypothetical protein
MSGSLAPSTPVNRRLAGITRATVNGAPLALTEFAWSPGGVKRETLSSMSGIDGYSEMPKAPYISGKFRDGQSISLAGFNALTDATVVLQLANGKQIVGHGLWNTGETEVAGTEATFDFKFEGIQGAIYEMGVR